MHQRNFIGLIALVVVVTGDFTPAAAQSPYQAARTATNCTGENSCTIVFPKISSSNGATIQHVSCSAQISSYHQFYLAALYAKNAPSVFDSLSSAGIVYGSSGETESVVNSQTVFVVNSGDAPAITLVAAAAMLNEPTCFISGISN